MLPQMRSLCFTIAVLSITALAPTQDVAQLAKLQHIEWQGVQAVDSQKLEAALVAQPDYADTASPRTEFSDFAAGIERYLGAIYRNNGYLEATAKASFIDDHLRITLKEGKRSLIGSLLISGNKLIDTDRLRKAFAGEAGNSLPRNIKWHRGRKISSDERRNGSRIWVPGKAPRLRTIVAQAERRVAYTYSLIGRNNVRTEVEWKASPSSAEHLDLHVQIHDEGQAVEISSIHVSGDEIDYVNKVTGLTKGFAWTLTKQHEIERKLYATGRYFDVRCEHKSDHSFHITLKVADFAPPPKDMPQDVLATLKLGRAWILQHLEDGGSFLVSPSAMSDEWPPSTIMIGKHGFLIEVKAQESVPAFALHVRNGGGYLSLPDIGVRIVVSEGTAYHQVQMTMETDESGGQIHWGAGVQQTSIPVLLATITDATLLRLAIEGEPRWTDTALSIGLKGQRAEIDRKTGRVGLPGVKGVEFLSESQTAARNPNEENRSKSDTLVLNDGFDPDKATAIAARVSEFYLNHALSRPALGQLTHTVHSLIAPLLHFLDDSDFDTAGGRPHILDYKRLIPCVARVLGRSYPEGSWPEAITWHGMNLVATQTAAVRESAWGNFTLPLRKEAAGPVASLAMLHFLKAINMRGPAVSAIARYGLGHMSFEAAWNDLCELLPDPKTRTDAVAAFGALLRALDQDAALSPELSESIRALPKPSTDLALAKAFAKQYWKVTGQAWLTKQLKRHAK